MESMVGPQTDSIECSQQNGANVDVLEIWGLATSMLDFHKGYKVLLIKRGYDRPGGIHAKLLDLNEEIESL